MGWYEDHVLPHLIHLTMRGPQFLPYRRRLLEKAEGRVLEIGIGSAANLPFYTERAVKIVGIDPHPKLLAMSAQKASGRMWVIGASAESVPLPGDSVDTVVTTWTLCSIPDVLGALGEVRRVLKPGGRLLFVEHGLAKEESVSLWQRRLTPIWKRMAGGCHLDRPIAELVKTAGFEVEDLRTEYMPGPRPLTFTYEGCGRKL